MSALVPVPTPATVPYWEAAKRQELHLQRCAPCQRFYFYPRPFCPFCNSDDVHWQQVSGRARLVSYTINYRPFPPFDRTKPLVHGLVELEEGPRMLTNIVRVDPTPENLPLDLELQVTFEDRGEFMIPVFAPREQAV